MFDLPLVDLSRAVVEVDGDDRVDAGIEEEGSSSVVADCNRVDGIWYSSNFTGRRCRHSPERMTIAIDTLIH